MKKILSQIFVLVTCVVSVTAQDAVEVKKVDFKKTSEDWVQMEVEMECLENPAADARDKDYVEAVKVKVYLAYERDASARLYDYYSSEVEIVIMEAKEDYNVYFYLPGLIAERDQLSQPAPAFYYVEVSVGGVVQAPQGRSKAISDSIANLQVLQSFLAKAEEGAARNEFMLLPIYYTPSQFWGRVDDLPLFLRRDPRD